MKHANELKIGIAVILTAIIGFIGFRFMQNLPAVGGTYEVVTTFKSADGILVSTPVKIRGVQIGKVSKLEFKSDKSEVIVRMQVDKEITIPTDSKVSLEGIDGVGGIRMEIHPGNPNGPMVKDGGFITAIQKPELLANLANQATGIVSKLDSVMIAANYRMSDVGRIMNDPNGALNMTVGNANEMISSLTETIRSMQTIVNTQQRAINAIMASADASVSNVNGITADARRFTTTQTDSLARALQNMNRLLTTTKETVGSLYVTTQNLNNISGQIANGNGSVARLLNDQSQLYSRIDSLSVKLNEVMADLKQNPRKYLRGLVKVF